MPILSHQQPVLHRQNSQIETTNHPRHEKENYLIANAKEEDIMDKVRTDGWPATPDEDRMDRALSALKMMASFNRMGVTTEQISIPALVPQDERRPILNAITTPKGQKVRFDRYHEGDIQVPDNIIMKRSKVIDAQAAHDCLQAKTFQEACVDFFNEAQIERAEETWWFMHEAGHLGDSNHTIGLIIQKPLDDMPNKDHTTVTKLTRHTKWMGYNFHLPALNGLTFRIYSAEDTPELPSYAIGFPSYRTVEGENETTEKMPNGEARLLAKILKYHGAERCLWIDRTV